MEMDELLNQLLINFITHQLSTAASDIPLPKDIPLPTLPMRSTHGILKKTTGFDSRSQIGPVFVPSKNYKPPGPPPGTPPSLSDFEDDDDNDDGGAVEGDHDGDDYLTHFLPCYHVWLLTGNQHAGKQKSVPEKDSESEEVPAGTSWVSMMTI